MPQQSRPLPTDRAVLELIGVGIGLAGLLIPWLPGQGGVSSGGLMVFGLVAGAALVLLARAGGVDGVDGVDGGSGVRRPTRRACRARARALTPRRRRGRR